MKTRIIFIIAIFFITLTSFAQTKSKKVVTADIKVYGNCGMCKGRIEAALDRKGIKQAKWDPTTKNLNVVYVPSKITEQQICDIVASVGHDTDKSKRKTMFTLNFLSVACIETTITVGCKTTTKSIRIINPS